MLCTCIIDKLNEDGPICSFQLLEMITLLILQQVHFIENVIKNWLESYFVSQIAKIKLNVKT